MQFFLNIHVKANANCVYTNVKIFHTMFTGSTSFKPVTDQGLVGACLLNDNFDIACYCLISKHS